MAPIRETFRNTANRVVDVLKQKAYVHYQHGCLKLETDARVLKKSIESTAPYLVLTGLSNVCASSSRTPLPPPSKKQQTSRTSTTGRIEKPKRHGSPAERDFRWYDMKMKREASEMAREKEIRLREEQLKMAEEKKRQKELRASSDQWAVDRHMSIKASRSQLTPPPPPPYVPEKSPYSDEFYANQTPEERRKFIHERLTNILGEEKMKAPILPSGHNPIEPVIAEHNKRVATESIIDAFESRRAEIQRRVDEQMWMAHQAHKAYVRTEVLWNHYHNIYQGRINRLAMYTGEMGDNIDLLDNAIANNDVWEVANTIQFLTQQIFDPVLGLLQECDNEIPLAVDDAQKLKAIWPLARLEEVYGYLVSKADGLEPQVVFMAQLIEAIAHRIKNPTPLVNPLEQEQQPTNNFCANHSYTNTNTAASSNPISDNGASILGAAPAAPEGGFSIRGRASTSGVDPDAYVPGAATSAPAGSGISKLTAATLAKAADNQLACYPAGSEIPSITVEPVDSVARQNVIHYISTDNMVLETEIQDMFRSNEIKSNHRRAVKECIDGLLNAANGEESILGSMDAGHYRSQIEKCVTRIDALPLKIRQNKDTQALKKLCGRALKIWAIHD
ncbi:hypothetical protein CC77DRAFT_1067635 [Alternaria alternata]|uniref:Uncharacterized protein n=1 Tax=Alternaria alternata TaxID=5599 RepID=A0A177D2I5_ALTAL|nr:hypothetical protein CC77DRAFT_1067635 [Alternaria alternata]OAG13696.1 hypothetical protein CC77DRAFT_1067635 [Alternaria alternata]